MVCMLSYCLVYFDTKLMSKVIMSYLFICQLNWAIPNTRVYSMGMQSHLPINELWLGMARFVATVILGCSIYVLANNAVFAVFTASSLTC